MVEEARIKAPSVDDLLYRLLVLREQMKLNWKQMELTRRRIEAVEKALARARRRRSILILVLFGSLLP